MSHDAKWLRLESLPAGSLFVTQRGERGVKSEYHYSNGAPECILLASGEYAHFPDKGNTLVHRIYARQYTARITRER